LEHHKSAFEITLEEINMANSWAENCFLEQLISKINIVAENILVCTFSENY
jgi:hypothetical protein